MIRNILSSLAVLSALAMPLAAHADTFGGTATFSDTSNSGNNFANFSGVFAHSPFTFTGPVGTFYTDQLTITSSGGTFFGGTATDNIAVAVAFTAPNGANGGFNGTAYLTSAERLDPRVGAWQPVGGLHLVNHSCTIRWTGIKRCTVCKSIYGAQQSHCMQIWGIRCFLIIRCTV